jgi:hypothetical protein
MLTNNQPSSEEGEFSKYILNTIGEIVLVLIIKNIFAEVSSCAQTSLPF